MCTSKHMITTWVPHILGYPSGNTHIATHLKGVMHTKSSGMYLSACNMIC